MNAVQGRAGASLTLLLLLSVASSLSPFGMVVVVPTLNEFAQNLGIDYSSTQYLLSAYLFGLGIAQPVSGGLADRFGRRRVILVGFGIFSLASIACAFATSLEWLTVLRFLQAAGVSVGTVGSRAIIRDTHDEVGTVRALAFIAAAMGIAPMVAPAIGGWLSSDYGTDAVFIASAALGFGVCLAMYVALPETIPRPSGEPAPRRSLTSRYLDLLGSRIFMGYTLMFGFTQGAMFCFLAVGAAVFADDFGIGQRGFGLIWGGMALVYVIATIFGGKLSQRYNFGFTARVGVWVTFVSGWLLLVCVTVFGPTLLTVVGPLTLTIAASGLLTPITLAGAVSYRPEIAGTSAGLSSSLGLVMAGLFTVLSGNLYVGQFDIIALLIALIGSALLITLWMVRPNLP